MCLPGWTQADMLSISELKESTDVSLTITLVKSAKAGLAAKFLDKYPLLRTTHANFRV